MVEGLQELLKTAQNRTITNTRSGQLWFCIAEFWNLIRLKIMQCSLSCKLLITHLNASSCISEVGAQAVNKEPSSSEVLSFSDQLWPLLSLLWFATVLHVVHLWTAMFVFPYGMLLDCYQLWHALHPTWFRICLWISFCLGQLLHHSLLILVIQIISSFIG